MIALNPNNFRRPFSHYNLTISGTITFLVQVQVRLLVVNPVRVNSFRIAFAFSNDVRTQHQMISPRPSAHLFTVRNVFSTECVNRAGLTIRQSRQSA